MQAGVLKTAFFGLGRDLALLDRLTDRHESLEEQPPGSRYRVPRRPHIWRSKPGFAISSRSPVLTKADVRPFVVSDSLDLFESDKAQWPRSRDTYRAPLLLVREFLQAGGRAVSPLPGAMRCSPMRFSVRRCRVAGRDSPFAGVDSEFLARLLVLPYDRFDLRAVDAVCCFGTSIIFRFPLRWRVRFDGGGRLIELDRRRGRGSLRRSGLARDR